MKRCLILIYMLGNILFAAADNTATKEALSVALKSISSPEEKLEMCIRDRNKDDDSKKSYSEAMKYFIIFALLIFLADVYKRQLFLLIPEICYENLL